MHGPDKKGHTSPASEPPEVEISSSPPSAAAIQAELDESDTQTGKEIALPVDVAGSGAHDLGPGHGGSLRRQGFGQKGQRRLSSAGMVSGHGAGRSADCPTVQEPFQPDRTQSSVPP